MVAQQDPVVGETKSKVCDNKTHNLMMMMIKGKRTKRSRPMSPLALTMSSATATTTTDEGGASSSTSEEFVPPPISTATATSEEEEDMAHCLILLAQGSNQKSTHNSINIPKGNITSSYECKTCNKSFSSFQALGGHRASHKKPKPTLTNTDHHYHHHDNHLNHQQFDDDRTMLSLQIYSSAILNNNNNNNNKGNNKVHECGICGAEFSSGQALGGHMRRHRPIGTSATTNKDVVTVAANNNLTKEEAASSSSTRNLLSLDLNLPAPEDEFVHLHQLRDSNSNSKFVFPSNEKTLVFSASSQLVDCHY